MFRWKKSYRTNFSHDYYKNIQFFKDEHSYEFRQKVS
jgi:hypothetical protein